MEPRLVVVDRVRDRIVLRFVDVNVVRAGLALDVATGRNMVIDDRLRGCPDSVEMKEDAVAPLVLQEVVAESEEVGAEHAQRRVGLTQSTGAGQSTETTKFRAQVLESTGELIDAARLPQDQNRVEGEITIGPEIARGWPPATRTDSRQRAEWCRWFAHRDRRDHVALRESRNIDRREFLKDCLCVRNFRIGETANDAVLDADVVGVAEVSRLINQREDAPAGMELLSRGWIRRT